MNSRLCCRQWLSRMVLSAGSSTGCACIFHVHIRQQLISGLDFGRWLPRIPSPVPLFNSRCDQADPYSRSLLELRMISSRVSPSTSGGHAAAPPTPVRGGGNLVRHTRHHCICCSQLHTNLAAAATPESPERLALSRTGRSTCGIGERAPGS